MFIESTEPLITMSRFADLLYDHSAGIAAISVERENYKQYRSNIVDPASDARRFEIYAEFINVVRDEIKISPDLQQRWTALNKEIRAYQPAMESSTALDHAIQAWIQKADFENKAMRAYFLQIFSGFVVGIGLITLASALQPTEQEDSTEAKNLSLADAWFFMLYLTTSTATPILRRMNYKKINQIINQCMGQKPDHQNFLISSTPFFEAVSWPIQMYPAMKYLSIDDGSNPINWLTILFPPAGMMVGNLVGRGVDQMRTLCQWRSTTNAEQAPLLRASQASLNYEDDNSGCSRVFKYFK